MAAAALLLTAAGAALAATNATGWHDLWTHFAFGEIIVAVTFTVVGGTVAARAPAHPIGWLLLAVGVVNAVSLSAVQYLAQAGPSRFGTALAWWASWFWLLGVLPFALIFLIFPDGRPRWAWSRVLVWAQVALTAFGVMALALSRSVHADGMPSWYRNPLAVGWADHAYDWFQMLLLPSWVIAVVVLLLRWWRPAGPGSEQRRQIGLFVLAGVVAVGIEVGLVGISDSLGAVGYLIAWPLVAVSAGAVVLRGRLYGVDTLLSRAVVGAVLAGFVALAYLALVTALGALIGRGTVTAIAATAVIAFAFHPVQRRVRDAVHRLVHGARPAPARVLSRFAQRAGAVSADDAVLTDLAALVVDGVGAAEAAVSVSVGGEFRPPPLHGPQLPVYEGTEQVGLVSVRLRAGAALTAADEALLADLAGLAGPVLRALRLRAQLTERNAELAASRARLATAATRERRRIERDLHDGAQQRLIALKLRLGLAARAAQRAAAGDTAAAAEAIDAIDEARHDSDRAIEELRDLVHGIYPTALDTEGLAGALRAQARLAPVPVSVREQGSSGIRPPRDIEAAAYFCCLEALQNAVKHAAATRIEIRVGGTGDGLSFTVADDGSGIAPSAMDGHGLVGLADRAAALGGEITVATGSSGGTEVRGWLPFR